MIVIQGETSVIRRIHILDSTSTTGAGKTGLAYDTSGWAVTMWRPGLSTPTSITLENITTLGTYQAPSSDAHVRFKEVSDGEYEIQMPNSWFSTSYNWRAVKLFFKGPAGVVPLPIMFEILKFELNKTMYDFAYTNWEQYPVRALTQYPVIVDSPGVVTLLNRVIGTIAAGTHYPQSGDSYARIGANGSGLTNLGDPRLANLDATVSSRLAGSAYTPPDNASVSAIKSTTDKLDTTVELDGSTWRFTANALEMAPSSGGFSLTPSQEQTLADLSTMIEGDGTPSARFTLNALSNVPAGEGGGGTVVIVSGDQNLTITDPMEPYHTVEKVVSEVQLTFPDVDQSVILDCINRVHQDLCAEYPVYRATQRIDLVAGQREYPIASSAQAVRRARYLPSEGSYVVLEPCGVADLDVEEPGWAWQNPGQPYRFYIDGGFVGIDPIPSESTDADYPRVELDIVWAVPLTLTDRLPASIKSRQVYVQGAKRFIAEWAAADKLGMYETLYNKEFQDVERYMGRRNRQYKMKATPSPGGFGFHQV